MRDVVRQYVDAREARDPKAVAALFTADADQLVSSGEWRLGRDNVVSGSLASSAQSAGKRTIDVERVHFVSTDVAIADGRYSITGMGEGNDRRMWSTFVMVKSSGWLADRGHPQHAAGPAGPRCEVNPQLGSDLGLTPGTPQVSAEPASGVRPGSDPEDPADVG